MVSISSRFIDCESELLSLSLSEGGGGGKRLGARFAAGLALATGACAGALALGGRPRRLGAGVAGSCAEASSGISVGGASASGGSVASGASSWTSS